MIAEIGEPWRFRNGRLVGTYARLTPRVSQSGEHCYHGHITNQGSLWLRRILVRVAMHVVRQDPALKNFYQGIRNDRAARLPARGSPEAGRHLLGSSDALAPAPGCSREKYSSFSLHALLSTAIRTPGLVT